MDDLESYLKEVQLFSKTQRSIFNENKQLIREVEGSLKTLGEIRRQHETAVDQIQGSNHELVLLLHGAYKLTDVDKMIGYFTETVLPNLKEINKDRELSKEYSKLVDFVLGRTVDHLIYTVTTNYYDVRYDANIKGYDRFLQSFKRKTHENKILKVVFDKFIEQLEEDILDTRTSVLDIFRIFVEDLDHLFDEPQDKKYYLVDNFVDYLGDSLLSTIYYKNFSNVANFVLIIRKLQHFYEVCAENKLSDHGKVQAVDKQTFQTFKSYANNYNDKFELLAVFDENHEFVSQYFNAHEQKSIKLWIIDLIDNYLHMIAESDRDKLAYGSLVFRFYWTRFDHFDKLLNNYFTRKLNEFIDEYYDDYFSPLELPAAPDVDPSTTKLSTIVDTYKKYFKQFRGHLDAVIEKVKGVRFKSLEFKRFLNEEAIKRYIGGYHKTLTEFLELDTGNIDKRKIFKLYANEVENRLRNELLVE